MSMNNRGSGESTVAANKHDGDDKNPYAYLERGDFTSEKFKIEVRGLPKYYGIGELKRLFVEKLDLSLGKVKPPKRGSGWVYVCFRSEEDRTKAIAAINGITWKNSKLSAQVKQLRIYVGRSQGHFLSSGKNHCFVDYWITFSKFACHSFHLITTRRPNPRQILSSNGNWKERTTSLKREKSRMPLLWRPRRRKESNFPQHLCGICPTQIRRVLGSNEIYYL